MFSLTVSFGPAPQAWILMYKTKEAADLAYVTLTDRVAPAIEITDDYGQRANFSREQIHALLLEDMAISQMAYVERVLHQARGNAKSQEMAQADQMLNRAMMRQQGSSPILQPMGGQNGRWPG